MKTAFLWFLAAHSIFVPAQKIIQASLAYGVDPMLALNVAQCESGLKQTAVGDHGLAYGIYQYHRQTFDAFSDEAGVDLNYRSMDDQIELFMVSLKNGHGNHWTCWRKVVNDAV